MTATTSAALEFPTRNRKLLAWVEVHTEDDREKARLQRWKRANADLIDYVDTHQAELFPEVRVESVPASPDGSERRPGQQFGKP